MGFSLELYTLGCTHNNTIQGLERTSRPICLLRFYSIWYFNYIFIIVIPIIWWPIYSDLSLRRSISFDVHDSSFYLIVLSYCVSLRSEFRYDFRIKTIQGSSLPPVVVCRRVHVLFTLFVFVYVWHIVLCFVFLRLVYPMLAVLYRMSICDCPFGILWRLFYIKSVRSISYSYIIKRG